MQRTMQTQETDQMSASRRGRPPTGAPRKVVVQITLEPEDAEALDAAAPVLGYSKAGLGAALVRGEASWSDVIKAARKARK